MEKVVCDRQDCQQSAVKYCFNCKAMLCKLHRIADVKAQLTSQLPEHFHIEAFRYSSDPSQFVRLYCDIHPCELLTHRCVNCMQFACQQCILSWCPKAAGRYHDYDKIADFAGRFKEKINELKEKLQLKNELFLQELKDSSRKLEETRMDLNQMLQKVDETVESKVATLRKEGERLKNEIVIEMTEATGEIEMQIKYVEEKEAACKTLLDSIHELLTTAADYTVVLNYRKIYEEVNDLLKSRIKDFEPTPVKLIQGTQSKMSLDLALTGTVVRTAFHNSDYLLPREEKFHVAEYLDILYIISQKKPTKVMRLRLSDGGLKDEIPCDGLPSIIEDISIRGNTLAVAGGNEGISYFRITDVM